MPVQRVLTASLACMHVPQHQPEYKPHPQRQVADHIRQLSSPLLVIFGGELIIQRQGRVEETWQQFYRLAAGVLIPFLTLA